MTLEKNPDGSVTITAPVLIPDARDCDYENGETPLSKEQIKEFAKSYEQYQFIDSEHLLTIEGKQVGKPVKSFLLEKDTSMTLLDGTKQTYPAGSWFVTSNITDPQAIATALKGGYTGYSVSVFSKSRADAYLNALKADKNTPLPPACKSGLNSQGTGLIKDVIDPVVLSVSLVRTPCLHQSKLCQLNDGENMEDDVKSLKARLLNAMDMPEQAEVEALKSEVVDLKAMIEETQKEFHKAFKSLQEELKSTLEDALKPVESEANEPEDETETEKAPAEEKAVDEKIEETEDEAEKEAESEAKEENAEPAEVVAEKGHSKAKPVHDADSVAKKSKTPNIYEFLGRNPDGTRKLKR